MKPNRKLKHRPQIVILTLLIVASLFLVACGTTQPESFTVGITHPSPVDTATVAGFKEGMSELGYVEGENITYIYDGPAGGVDKLDGVIQGLVEAEVDLIYTPTTPATKAAKQATEGTGIEVVFGPVSDPIKADIVTDLTHPGGNITGVKLSATHGRRLEWLLDIVPNVKRVYIPYNPDDASPVSVIETIKEPAATLGVELVLGEARNDDEITAAIEAIPEDVEAIFLVPDSSVNARIDDFVAVALERNLPISAPSLLQVEAGALTSYGFVHFEVGKQAARLADQILKGAKPADLPIETAEFFLTINLKSAKAIGLDVPDEVLRQADEIIR